ncbi:hypothetical protein HOG48_01200 [Candidatus Peregrinibacteria bacterium]|jgi:flavodoxin I|nr:hypothetical protein [Candidatus Peregrinibacteria bacterium]
MASILLIYGTTGGNTEIVAEAVSDGVEERGHEVKLMRIEKYLLDEVFAEIEKCDVMMIAAPTYGHGEMQMDLKPFLKELSGRDLKGKKCIVVGLGEAKYDDHYHIASVPILEELLTGVGAELVFRPLRISGNPATHLDRLIPLWIGQFCDFLEHSGT